LRVEALTLLLYNLAYFSLPQWLWPVELYLKLATKPLQLAFVYEKLMFTKAFQVEGRSLLVA